MKNYKAILIGNGTMGKRHRSRFEANGVLFTEVLDVDAMEALRQGCWERPDFVVIASPATSHYEYAKFFLERGISVFVEKPLAVSAAEARELLELSEKNNILLFVAQSECFNPIFLNFRTHFMTELRRGKKPRLEFRREHGFTERCRDVDVSLDILVHDLSMFLTMFNFDDIQVENYKNLGNRAVMTIEVCRGEYAGVVADFIVDRNSANDVRTISVDFDDSCYSVSLANYLPNGEIAHVPDSLDNEHKFFLKLLVGACREWGKRSARIAAQVVQLVTAH